jgi:hypothetical protein
MKAMPHAISPHVTMMRAIQRRAPTRDVKQTRAPAIHAGGEPEIRVHLQRSDGDVGPIDVSDEVEQHQKRQQPPREDTDRAGFEGMLP